MERVEILDLSGQIAMPQVHIKNVMMPVGNKKLLHSGHFKARVARVLQE